MLRIVLKFIPARGRKRLKARNITSAKLVVEIYPREGTETVFLLYSLKFDGVEIYLREGTETQRCQIQLLHPR